MRMIFRMAASAAMAVVLSAPALLAQDFDFKLLDKLGANAKSSTNVTLSGPLLKLAAGFLGSDGDKDAESLKSLVANLRAINVRNWEFSAPHQYDEADLAPLRAFLKGPKWVSVVDIKEDHDSTQIYFSLLPNDKLGGVAVIESEPKELTVVYIDGELEMRDLQRLSGNMGIPQIRSLPDGKAKADNKNQKK